MSDNALLNEEQKKAAYFGNGPLLIIAGAGTGKTTVITERIKHLILEKKINPAEILALTFTEKAALEMEERVDIALPYGYTQMWISTFHAFCDRVLRNDAIQIGLDPSYLLASDSDSILFLRKNLSKFHLNYFRPLGNPNKFIQGLLQHFSRLKDEDVNPEQYLEYAEKLLKDTAIEQSEIDKTIELANAYKIYDDLKTKEGVMDFSDLISNTLRLFRARKNVLKEYQEKFKYILIDEFQDTNYSQNILAILLAGERQNITVVGDDDQAIYRWRGAAISNMIQFKEHFPNTEIVTLTKNYRSTEKILEASYKLIQNNNPNRLEVKENINKKLTSTRVGKSSEIGFLYADRVENEAELVAKKIEELVNDSKYSYSDFAILLRANDYSQPFISAFTRFRIPYQFLGPSHLFQQEEIKDLIAYLRILNNFEESSSMYRVLTIPIFDIDARDIATLLNFAKRKNVSLFEAMEKAIIDTENTNLKQIEITETSIGKIKQVVEMIRKHLKLVAHESAGQIMYYFMQDSGILQELISGVYQDKEKVSSNIAKFFDKLKSFETEHEDASIFAVIDWIALLMQTGESPIVSENDWSENNAVNLLTIHSSKGLEFSNVFLVNLVSQRFPSRERREQIPIPQNLIKEILPTGDYHLEEERRLFYVGMTRARDNLFLTASSFYGDGKRERKLSPFLYEALGEHMVDNVIKSKKSEKTVIQESLLDWGKNNKENTTLLQKPIPQTKITYISYSQLQTFDICPLHYKLKYLLKIPSFPTPSQSFGTSVHNVLKDYYYLWSKGEIVSAKTVDTLIEKNWIDEGYANKSFEKEAKEKAVEIIKTYLENNFDENKNPQDIILETPFQFFISTKDRKGGIKIGGRIDRIDKLIDGTIEIIDYKTGKTPTNKKLEEDLQLTFYALAATHVNDLNLNKKPEEVLLSLYYLEEGKKLTTHRSKEQLEEAKEEIMKKVGEIETSDFMCTGSIFCTDCEYKILCSNL